MGLESAAASQLISSLGDLATLLPCPMVLSCVEWSSVEVGRVDRLDDPVSVIEGTKQRLIRGIIGSGARKFLSRIPRIPLTCNEVKTRLILRHERDERRAIYLLAQLGSVSTRLVYEWGLTRGLIKEALRELCHNRGLQVTPGTILTGARFKCFDSAYAGEGLAPTICRKCFIVGDSIQHMLVCYELGVVPKDEDGLLVFLQKLARETVVRNPNVPLKMSSGATQMSNTEMGCDPAEQDVLWQYSRNAAGGSMETASWANLGDSEMLLEFEAEGVRGTMVGPTVSLESSDGGGSGSSHSEEY